MKCEIETLIQSGRKLIESDSVVDADNYATRLDALKSLYNKVSQWPVASVRNIRIVLLIRAFMLR